jgi:hypothetical protein
MKKIISFCFLAIISFVFLFNSNPVNACTAPVIQYTNGTACTSQQVLNNLSSNIALLSGAGMDTTQAYKDYAACKAQVNQYIADNQTFNNCIANILNPTITTQPTTPASYATNPPQVLDIEPSGGVIPSFTKICMKGQNFGTAAQGWTTKSSISINGTDISRAAWTDTSICFTAPDGLPLGGKMVYINLNINGYTNFQPLGIITTSDFTNDTYTNKQYYLHNIDAFNGWAIQPNANGVVVAVIDDGVYINHPDLRQNIWTNTKEIVGNGKDDDHNGYVDDIYGWDFISNTAEMTTRGSHGTMVAGIIGAVKNNSAGIAGIADGVKIMPLIACDDSGCPTDAVIKAIRYAADNGANIINLSLGTQGTTNYTDKYNDAIKYAYNKGVVIVAAAGNGDSQGQVGQSTDQIPVSPVCNDNGANMVLGVSGTDTADNYINWANWGSCVDVVAPALSITSTSVPDFSGAFYDTEDGTSFAAPMVAGLAALLKAKYPTISNTDIIAMIKRNAVQRTGYNNALGSGEIDIGKTLQDKYVPSNPVPIVATTPNNSSTILNQTVQTTSSSNFTFTKNLSKGMSGNVMKLQLLLQKLGFLSNTITANGYFGSLTQNAVIAFQKSKGISGTGFVGALTRQQLNSNLNN